MQQQPTVQQTLTENNSSQQKNCVESLRNKPFTFESRTRLIFGIGAINQLGEVAKKIGGKQVLLVSDPGIVKAGHAAKGIKLLEEAGFQITSFYDFVPNPTTDDVEKGLAVAIESKIDIIIGLGGGSSLDCAKGINFLLTNGGKMQDYWGVGKATKPMLPMIAVPTTSGTGSEAQSFALIADNKTHMKMACGDKKAACHTAILDPELTVSMPRTITAATGIDAISHAIETYVTTRRNSISQAFSRQAWKLLSNSFCQVLANPNNIDARGDMLLGANLAGAAIENSMLGATHALANPLSAHFGITHGVAIGTMLPNVIRFNGQIDEINSLYADLAVDAGLCTKACSEASELLAAFVKKLVDDSGLSISLTKENVSEIPLSTLAEEAAKQWTGTFNPRPLEVKHFEELYRCTYLDQKFK